MAGAAAGGSATTAEPGTRSGEALFLEGIRLHQTGQLAQAEALYRQVIAANPRHVRALHHLGAVVLQHGQAEEAVGLMGRALEIEPNAADILTHMGVALRQVGRLDEALRHFSRAVAVRPDFAAGHYNLGNGLIAAGKLEEAAASFRRAVALQPDLASAHNNLGHVLNSLGRHTEAEPCLRQALALKPDYDDAMFNLGVTLGALDRADEAEACYRRAVAIRPSLAPAWHNLANLIAKHKEEIDEAIECYRRAVAADPNYAEGYNGLGNALQTKRQHEAAEANYRRAIELKPGLAEAHNNLGNILQVRLDYEGAIEAYQRALALDPNNAETHSNLGAAYRALTRHLDALESYRRALALKPGHAGALYNIGNCYASLTLFDEAIDAFQQAIALRPDYAEAMNNLGGCYQNQGRLKEAETMFRMAVENLPTYATANSNVLFLLSYHRLADSETILAEHRLWEERVAPPEAKLRPPYANDRNPERRLRIGYVSSDFKTHSVSSFIEPILAAHNRQRVELFCYAEVAKSDSVTERIRADVDSWRVIHGVGDDDVAQMIRDDRIDILIDLNGHTSGNRLRVFCYKPAPVQATYLGYFTTTGLSTMDYWITDGVLCPPDTAERTVEEIYRLPRCWLSYQPLVNAPDVAPAPESLGEPLTFGSFNNIIKLTPRTIALWSRVLNAFPASRMILKATQLSAQTTRDRLRTAFAAHGIAGDRFIMYDRIQSFREHLAVYDRLDIALDPTPLTGGTTTADALWMGVPVVTLAGQAMVERMSASFLTAIDRPEWIATSEDEYVDIVARLVRQKEERLRWRAEQRQRVAQSPLRDHKGLAVALEDAYADMFRRWCARADAAPALTVAPG